MDYSLEIKAIRTMIMDNQLALNSLLFSTNSPKEAK